MPLASRDSGDLDCRVRLTVTPPTTVIGLVLIGEGVDLGPSHLFDHTSRDCGSLELLWGSEHSIAVHQHHWTELNLALWRTQALNTQALALLEADGVVARRRG